MKGFILPSEHKSHQKRENEVYAKSIERVMQDRESPNYRRSSFNRKGSSDVKAKSPSFDEDDFMRFYTENNPKHKQISSILKS